MSYDNLNDLPKSIRNVLNVLPTVGSSAATGGKVFWVVLILILPVLGVIIWIVAGPGRAKEGS